MTPMSKILVFRKSSLGDVILTLPVLNVLMRRFPEAEIDYLTKSIYAPLIRHQPSVDNVIAIDKSSSFLKVISRMRRNGYDLYVDLQSNIQSRALGTALGHARAVRYPKRRLARELVVLRPRLKLKVDHTVNAYFKALRDLDIDDPPSPPILALPPEYDVFADDFIRAGFGGGYSTLIALCPGARHFEKRWPRFKEAAEILLRKPGTGLFVISSATDDMPANLGLDDPGLIPVRDFEILKIAALMSKCKASITNDSGLMHLSCAVQTPVVAIFGPTNPRLGFAPMWPGSVIICDDVFCSPCSVHGKKPCRQPEKYCFSEISPERVADSLFKLL